MEKQRLFFLLPFFVLMLTKASLGFQESDSLIFMDGNLISGKIENFNAWSVTLDNGRIVALKELSEIKTSDSTLVFRFESFYPAVNFFKQGSTYSIKINNLSLPQADPYANNLIYKYFILLNLMTEPGENLEFQINLVPRFNHNFVGQFSVSSGIILKDDARYYQRIAAGIGYIFSFKWILVLTELNLGEKFLHLESDAPTISSNVGSFSLYAQIPFDHLLISTGARYNFVNIPADNDKTIFSFNFGIGYIFQITPN